MKHLTFNRSVNRPSNTLDRFFSDKFFNDNFIRDTWNRTFSQVTPAVNIIEHANSFDIELAAPGLNKEDFHLNLDKDLLTVKVAKEVKTVEDGPKWHRKEFSFNSFERSFRLPETIAEDKIGAKYENGVLRVTLPKRDEAVEKPSREIEIS